MIDTHCHLTDEKFEGKIEEVLEDAREAHVERILVPTVGLRDGRRAIELAEKYEDVWAMVGVHPEVLADETNPANRSEWLASGGDWTSRLEELARSSDRVIGIGEIGLDFYYDKEKTSKRLQTDLFRKQLELAIKLNLPAVIHMRNAETEIIEVMNEMPRLPAGQFHCWSGSEEFLNYILERDFYVSFCGNITYNSADNLRALISGVPLNRLLLETDSPYLAPEGRRSSINVPSNVKILAEYIAGLLSLDANSLINQTTKNALCLFFGGS